MSKRDAYIWGAAEYGKKALEYCKSEFNIVGFVDRRAGEEFKELCFSVQRLVLICIELYFSRGPTFFSMIRF